MINPINSNSNGSAENKINPAKGKPMKMTAEDLPQSSQIKEKLKTGTQKAEDMDMGSIVKKRGMRAANITIKQSAAETGKGNLVKTTA